VRVLIGGSDRLGANGKSMDCVRGDPVEA